MSASSNDPSQSPDPPVVLAPKFTLRPSVLRLASTEPPTTPLVVTATSTTSRVGDQIASTEVKGNSFSISSPTAVTCNSTLTGEGCAKIRSTVLRLAANDSPPLDDSPTDGPRPKNTCSSSSFSPISPRHGSSSHTPSKVAPTANDSTSNELASSRFMLRPSALRVAPTPFDTNTPVALEQTDLEPKPFVFAPLSIAPSGPVPVTSLAQVSSSNNGAIGALPSVVETLASPPRTFENGHNLEATLASPISTNNGNGDQHSNSEESFIFGQNIESRAIVRPEDEQRNREEEEKNAAASSSSTDQSSAAAVNLNGTTNRLAGAEGGSDQEASSPGASGQSTSETRKRTYEAITGEEDESNVLQIHCKLYSWETASSIWREKGKGFLKLNDKLKDKDKLCSRLVMRTAGSLKVILNCSLVVGMKFVLTNEKHLRFTNIDGIYLVKGKEKDIELLNSAIDHRLRELSKRLRSEEGHQSAMAMSGGTGHKPLSPSSLSANHGGHHYQQEGAKNAIPRSPNSDDLDDLSN